MKKSHIVSLAILVCSCVFAHGAEVMPNEELSGKLIVFHAGSLALPFKEVAEAFNKEYPHVRVLREAAGSRACARKIVDLNRECDVFGSADYTVIDSLLIPEHADWNIRFATNEMVIAYTEQSRRRDEINSENWYEILLDTKISFGRSDPNADPCGYRTVLTSKLAELHYGESGLAARLQEKDRRYIRPKETDLLALLEVGQIDYIFIYKSVASQHHLKYVELPEEVNLKSAGQSDFYARATVDISGKTPGSTITKQGAPMVYGVTIPKSSPNPKVAQAFVNFLLERENGLAILERNGQPSPVPTVSDSYYKIPDSLKKFATQP